MYKFDGKAFAETFFAVTGWNKNAKFDANDTIVFGRELEHIMARAYENKYVQNKARTLLDWNTECGPGTELATYRMFNEAAPSDVPFVDTYSDADFPRVTVYGAEYSTRFQTIGRSYGYNISDWEKAKLAGRPLDGMLAVAVRNAMERDVEKLAAVGDTAHNLPGLLNHSSVTIINPTSTSGMSGHVWVGSGANATALEMFSDLAFAFKKIYVDTNTVEEADTVVFPSKIYAYLKSTLFQPTYNTKTILQAMLEANPWIKNVDVWVRCDTAAANGTGRVLVYRKDPTVVQFMQNIPFEQSPPIIRAWDFSVQCRMGVGGIQLRYPKALLYIDGCDGGG